MNFLSDILTYIRRIIKSPSNSSITDNLLIDYVNRFWISDVSAEMQLFDLKTKYQFQTVPGVDQYNMPMYNPQTEPGGQTIGMYPMYQGFLEPVYVNGVRVSFQTQKNSFFNIYPPVLQLMQVVATGNGGSSYTIQLPILSAPPVPLNPPVNCILRGHVDITGIISTGQNVDPPRVTDLNTNIPAANTFPAFYLTTIDANGNSVVVADSGQFYTTNANLGLLMIPGNNNTIGNTSLGTYGPLNNTVNYLSGVVNVTFPVNIPPGAQINAQAYYFQTGLPRAVCFYNNILYIRSPPDQQYLVELDAYLSPAAFFNDPISMPFGYMAEYIARGAARKILLDTGDIEQFQFYEPEFKRQQELVWKRSQRQFTSTRTETIYSQGMNYGQGGFNNFGGGGI
jgi:hypothetical protein